MERKSYFDSIDLQFNIHSVCALLGPRQVGKTTLARSYVKERIGIENTRFFDLENFLDLARLDNPFLELSVEPEKLVVIDEIQMRPDLFPTLRVLVDEPGIKRKFLILGSASRDLIKQSSETLAGRIGYIELTPFSTREVDEVQKLWIRGGFPLSYLANTNQESFSWRQHYITSFLERDIPSLGFTTPPALMRRFWLMLSHYHGQIFNASEIGTALGISGHTARKYLDILIGTFMIRIMYPWFENIKKRQVKSPKIYFRDSGILHALVAIRNLAELHTHPKLGAFWEGFALEEIITLLRLTPGECFFWTTHGEAKLDLFVFRDGKRIGFEIKYADAPKITKSMRIAIEDLKLDHLYVVFPGNQSFSMDLGITAVGLESKLLQELASCSF